jgi:hypothetical protein
MQERKPLQKNRALIKMGRKTRRSARSYAQVNWKDRERVKRFYKSEKVLEYGRIVGDAAMLVCELLEGVTESKSR